jgi:uncharacterized membrane protein
VNWAVFESLVGGAPWVVLAFFGMVIALILLALLIGLHNADADERPEIIRALAELMPWRWRR